MGTEAVGHARHVVRPPGLHRLTGVTTSWTDEDGVPVTEAAALDRLRRLRIPPAWTHVWASADPESPIQATGVDARGRTQYRYSVAAQEASASGKYAHLLGFAAALPALREQIERDLRPGAEALTSTVVTAAVVRLLDRGLFRVGNERYERDNHTYGLTTLRRPQVTVGELDAVFDFVGKEHVAHRVTVADAAVVAVLEGLLAQAGDPDEFVFATVSTPHWRRVDSVSVNAYIHAHSAAVGSAKTFRTWGATVIAAAVTAGATFAGSTATRRRADLVPFDAAAHYLGNTPTVARRSYVHPAALDVGRSPAVADAVAAASHAAGSRDVGDLLHVPAVQAAVYEQLVETAAVQAFPEPSAPRWPA